MNNKHLFGSCPTLTARPFSYGPINSCKRGPIKGKTRYADKQFFKKILNKSINQSIDPLNCSTHDFIYDQCEIILDGENLLLAAGIRNH